MNLIYLCDSNILVGVFLTIFYIYFNKLLPKKQHMVITLSTCTLLTIGILFFEVLSSYLLEYIKIDTQLEKTLLYMLLVLKLACKAYLPIIWTLFLYTYKKREKKIYKKNVICMCILGHIFALILITTGLTGLVFKIGTAENILIKGPLYSVPSYISLIYLATCIIYLIIDKNSLSGLESIFLGFSCVIPLIGSVLEILNDQSLLLSSATATSILLTYILLQDYLTDYDLKTTALNRVRFEAILDGKEKEGAKDFSVVYFLVEDDAENSIKSMGETKNDLVADFGKILNTLLQKEDILSYYGENKYILFLNTTNTEYIFDKLNTLNNDVLKYNTQNTKSNLKYYYSIVKYDKSFNKITAILKKAYVDVINTRNEKKKKEETYGHNISNNK